MNESEKFETAMALFDAENRQDPNRVIVDAVEHPRELFYAQRLTDWVNRLSPYPSEPLRLAARSQHLCRWTIPRSAYPDGLNGYLQWREDLKQFHADKAGKILRRVGYEERIVQQVRALNLKSHFPNDPESRVLEDALCLVFLEFQFAETAAKTGEEKMIGILQKTWEKMSEQARRLAGKLPFSEKERALLKAAGLAPSSSGHSE